MTSRISKLIHRVLCVKIHTEDFLKTEGKLLKSPPKHYRWLIAVHQVGRGGKGKGSRPECPI